MFDDEKWISYSVRVLQAVSNGANSIKDIAERIHSPEAYTAKVVAALRKAGLITKEYDLAKSLESILISDIISLGGSNTIDPVIIKLIALTITGLNIPITQILS